MQNIPKPKIRTRSYRMHLSGSPKPDVVSKTRPRRSIRRGLFSCRPCPGALTPGSHPPAGRARAEGDAQGLIPRKIKPELQLTGAPVAAELTQCTREKSAT
jgi:hypothetical protein